MPTRLQISDRRERSLVRLADLALGAAGPALHGLLSRRPAPSPGRVLLLRLERIGDLLMTLDALAAVRARLAHAQIDLVVGSWNRELAALLPGLDRIDVLDAAWLSRDGGGSSLRELLWRARTWRRRRYDLAINFESDIRSNLLLAASGAGVRAGFRSGGGGALLTHALDLDPRLHTRDNCLRIVDAVLPPRDRSPDVEPRWPRIALPADAVALAADLLDPLDAGRPIVGLHASGGRPIKQWDPRAFADVAEALHARTGCTVLLTGSGSDRAIVEHVRQQLPASKRIVSLVGAMNLPVLAAVLARCSVFVTGDTGPMHLAAAVGTPVVAIFGPSDPRRYAPLARAGRVVRVQLPCSPCNRIRLPPARCQGRVPECLVGVTPQMVVEAALELLA